MRAKLLARIRTLETRARPSHHPVDITIQFVNGDGSLAELCSFKDGRLVELPTEERMRQEQAG
jgi:hypothetical protein